MPTGLITAKKTYKPTEAFWKEYAKMMTDFYNEFGLLEMETVEISTNISLITYEVTFESKAFNFKWNPSE